MRIPIPMAARALAAASLVLAFGIPAVAAPASHGHGTPAQQLALRQTMRKLWEDHITWTRLVIVSSVAGLPDLEPTTQRLLKNQADIGQAIQPFYGAPAAARLTALLEDHIVGAANILAAAKANEGGKLDEAKRAWYVNSDEIAAFLSAANPKEWPLEDMKSMMREHLDLTLSEAVHQLRGNYSDSVADYDKVHDAILEMADMLSDGIIKQFPAKFRT